jgi:2-dehydro-3-deoxyphosphogluconate aldolase/(4S)-4-hydroxy-2-oxoglutarate aldolase
MKKDKKGKNETVGRTLEEQGLLPMFSHENETTALKMLDAVYAGGVKAVEFTNRSAQALRVFKALKKHGRRNLPGLLLGAGTVLGEQDAKSFIGEGAAFIVAPILEKGVAKTCAEAGILWCPGAGTLTEIVQAQQLGAGMVKVFPARQLGGPAFIKAILAPCPWLRIMATGGVSTDPEDLKAWFEAGVKSVGIGSGLFSSEMQDLEDYDKVRARVAEALAFISSIRKS